MTKKTITMIVTVPRTDWLTPAEQRAYVREALRGTGDYLGQRVVVQPVPKPDPVQQEAPVLLSLLQEAIRLMPLGTVIRAKWLGRASSSAARARGRRPQ